MLRSSGVLLGLCVAIPALALDNGPAPLGIAGSGQMRIRSLDVTITGRLAGKNDFLRTVTTRVRFAADCALNTFSNCNNIAP